METIENQETPATEVTAAPEATEAAPVTTPDASPDVAAEQAPPAFVPDYKYKVSGEEKEIDPLLRSVIKDAETQRKVRELVERSEAFPIYKIKTQEYQGKIKEYEPIVNEVKKFQSMYAEAVESGDPMKHREVLQELGYTPEVLKDVVRSMLLEERMPEDQKKYFEAERRAQLELKQLRAQTEGVTTQYNEVLRDVTAQQVEVEFAKSDYQDMIGMYEKANGSGSFKDLFLQRGAYWVETEGRHLPPSEVMGRIAKEFAPFVQKTEPAASSMPGTAQATVIKEKPKVMPNVGAGNGSPAKQSVSSLDDLRAKYRQMTSQD